MTEEDNSKFPVNDFIEGKTFVIERGVKGKEGGVIGG